MKRLTYKIKDGAEISYITHPDNTKGHRECLNKLGELENAEEEGRLFVAPCQIGRELYRIVERCPKSKNRKPYMCITTIRLSRANFFGVIDDFGKTVFNDFQKAYKKMREMEARESLEEQNS